MPLKIGLSKTDITPPIGIFLAGYANRLEPSEGVYLPLTATAIAIDDGKTEALIIGAEILGFYEHTQRVRQRIGEKTGLQPHQIILNGSHTHCGPVLREVDRERHGNIDDHYIEQLIEKVATCAHQAWQNREPSILKFGTGTCNFAVNRRLPDANGIFQMRPNPNGPVDHTVSVLAIETPTGQTKGVLFSYACHPTSRGGLLIGGDYVGFALQHIEQNNNLTACFLQGCAGDIKPGPADATATTFTPRTIEQVQAIGEQLGQAVYNILQSQMLTPIDGELHIATQTIVLEMEPITHSQIEAGLQDPNKVIQQWATHFKNLTDAHSALSTQIPFEVQTLSIGSAFALVALSGEISVEYALRLQKDLTPNFHHAIICAYANHIIGYVPAKRQIPEGGYEVWANQYHLKRPGPYVETTEDTICDTAIKLLTQK
jgi:neutral ceramidase